MSASVFGWVPVFASTEIRVTVTGEDIHPVVEQFNRSQSLYHVTVYHQNFRNWRFAINYFRFMQERAAKGDATAIIDILFLDNNWLPAMIQQHWLASLSGKIAAIENVSKRLLDAATADGVIYGLPFSAKGLVLFFRKDLHLKYRLASPRTLPELVKNAQVLLAHKEIDHGLTIHESAIHLDILPFLWSNGGEILSSGKVVLNSPQNIATLTYLQSLKQQKILPSNRVFNELKGSYNNAKKQFLKGKSAYILTWSNRIADFKKSPLAGRFGVLPVPAIKKGAPAYSVIGSWYFAVNSYSPNKAGAIAFLNDFFSSRTQRYLVHSSDGYLPVLTSAYQDTQILSKNAYIKPFEAALANMRPRLLHPNEPEIELILENLVREIIIANKPVKPYLSVAQKRIIAVINPKLTDKKP